MDEKNSRLILWELSERLRLREALTRLYRVRVVGAENVPAGGCILVANHESVIDPWFLSLAHAPARSLHGQGGALAVRARPLGDGGLRHLPGRARQRRHRRDGPRRGAARRRARCSAMFPRGTSKPAGNRTWHRGAARLALAHGAPIVPVRLVEHAAARPAPPGGGARGRADSGPRARPTIAAARKLTADAESAVEAL